MWQRNQFLELDLERKPSPLGDRFPPRRGKMSHSDKRGSRWRVAPDEGYLGQNAAVLHPHQSPSVTASPDWGKPLFGKLISMHVWFFLLTNTHRVCIISLRGETMKQKDLINLFKRNGWWMVRQGSNHMVFTNGSETETVPRHKEVNELLAKAIIKRRGLK